MFKAATLLFASLFLLVLTTDVLAQEEVVTQEYAVSPGGTLSMDMDRGNIEIMVSDDNRVMIELERKVKNGNDEDTQRLINNHQYSFEQDGNDVYVESRYRGRSGGWGRNRAYISIKMKVKVPAQYNVEFENGSGNVSITDVNGMIEGETGSGNIQMSDVEGEVELSTGSGNIQVSGVIGDAEISTGSGNIKVHGLQGEGDIEVSTGSGNIEAKINEPYYGDSIEFSTGSGNLVVSLAEGIAVDVDAHTSSGRASSDFPMPSANTSNSRNRRSFSGSINGGGAELSMHTGSGNVHLKRM